MERVSGLPSRIVEIVTLCSFAVGQPLLDLLARHPEFLVVHRIDTTNLAILLLALLFAAPLLLALGLAALGRIGGERGGWMLHLVAVAVLAATIALPPLKRLSLSAATMVAIAVTLGVVFAAAHARWPRLRSFVAVLAPAPLVFGAAFWVDDSIARLRASAEAPPPHALAIERPVPVVVVIFDALGTYALLDEDLRIDARRVPHFAALARQSHWFRNATTVASLTERAVPAILTGLYPRWSRLPTHADHPRNLFTLLAETHTLDVVEGVTHLCPDALCGAGAGSGRLARLSALGRDLAFVGLHVLLPEEWTQELPTVTETWADFASPQKWSKEEARVPWKRDVPRIFDEFLARIAPEPASSLRFLHLQVPHPPFRYLPSGKEYARLDGAQDPELTRNVDAWAANQALQRYLLQVGYADTLLGQLVERLRERGLFDRALLVVTSDHGISYQPGMPVRGVGRGRAAAGDLLPVPLFIKLPGQSEGSVSDRNVETIDILPTILDVLGAHGVADLELDGRSAFDVAVPERPKKLFLQTFRPYPQIPPYFEFGPAAPGLEAATLRIASLFDLERADGLYSMGPHRNLVGRSPDSARSVADPSFHVRLDGTSALASVDPDSTRSPVLLTGAVEVAARTDDALPLAVSVNGTIRAVTRTFRDEDGSLRFSALVPEDSLRAGANSVEVFLVRERGSDLELVPAQGD